MSEYVNGTLTWSVVLILLSFETYQNQLRRWSEGFFFKDQREHNRDVYGTRCKEGKRFANEVYIIYSRFLVDRIFHYSRGLPFFCVHA